MLKLTIRGRVAKAGTAIAAASLAVASSVLGSPPAGADPKQATAFIGAGSDTTQDIMNALAGFVNGNNFVPVQSSAPSGLRQLTSWDAIGSTCITPKAGGQTFVRPNGSTNGRRALSRAIDGTAWPTTTADCGGPKTITGLVDYARSSAGPPAAGTVLTYIPFGRDALSFAYYRNGGAPVTTLTSAQLTSLFTSGAQIVDGVEIVPCGIQTGSGTYQSWNTAVGVNQATETTATTPCNNAGSGARVQENDAAGLKAKGDSATLLGKQVIIGFSAANFIAQNNGFAPSQLAAGVDLGAVDALGKPYTGTTPPLAASATFYASGTYGRDVYNVLPTSRVGGLAGSNVDFKTMFVGNTSAVCQATTTINNFGFSPIGSACGSITLQGALIAN